MENFIIIMEQLGIMYRDKTMKDQIKAEIIQINSSIYELQERKRELQIYLQGYEEAEKKAQEIEESLNNKIKELEKEE